MFRLTILITSLLVSACATTPTTPSLENVSTKTIAAAVDDVSRPAGQIARDEGRKPAEVLAFAGVKPGDKVGDLATGSGYYTAILSRVVGREGYVYAVDPERIFKAFPNARETFPKYQASDPRTNVSYTVQYFDQLRFPERLDVIVMGLYYHDTLWTGADRAAMNKAIFDALKPGGAYLVIDHLAADGAPVSVTQDLHRMLPGIARPEIESAGFVFAGESDLLRFPEDPRDVSVFDPAIRGKTDRFIYLFRKP